MIRSANRIDRMEMSQQTEDFLFQERHPGTGSDLACFLRRPMLQTEIIKTGFPVKLQENVNILPYMFYELPSRR